MPLILKPTALRSRFRILTWLMIQRRSLYRESIEALVFLLILTFYRIGVADSDALAFADSEADVLADSDAHLLDLTVAAIAA